MVMHINHKWHIIIFQFHNHTYSILNVINLDAVIKGVKLLNNTMASTKIHFRLSKVAPSITPIARTITMGFIANLQPYTHEWNLGLLITSNNFIT